MSEDQEAKPLQLRAGGIYQARNGAQFGPMEVSSLYGETHFREARRKPFGFYFYEWYGDGRFACFMASEHPLDLIREVGFYVEPEKPDPAIERLARKILPAIVAREYGGTHRDSPADAARIAFEYAEAFQAEARRRAGDAG